MMVRLSSVLITAGLFTATTTAVNTQPASGFVSSDGSISFALNIPQDSGSNELYFSLTGDSSCSWLAIGMGSDKMDDSLMFMVYSDPSGKNVTVSPRLSYGHVEPSYTNNITINVLGGTKIEGNTTTVNAKCSNCRSWKGGSIDPKNTAAKFIYATGPSGNLNTKSLTAGIKRHATYGAFKMDLTKAVGTAGAPIAATADSAGTEQTQDETDHDFSAPLHGCIMILAFVGLMPVAILILRVLNSPRWHGLSQTLSVVVALIGTCLGIYAGTMFNRSKNFNSAHQIFGVVIILAMIGQFVLGFLHHRMYKKTLAPTKLAPIHIWLGRVVIPAGIVNGFLGFPLALNSKFNWALLAIVLFVIILAGPLAFWRYRRNIQKAKTANAVSSDGSTGYQSQPWTNANNTQSDINLGQINYPPPQQNYPPIYQNPGYGR